MSPCPPPPPPVYNSGCPVPAPISAGSVSPVCYRFDCDNWGAVKSYDGKMSNLATLTASNDGTNPFIQLELPSTFTQSISAVKIYGRVDCCMWQGQHLNVYLSPTTNFTAGMLCAADISMARPGDIQTVLCPVVSFQARYVTIMRNTTVWDVDQKISLQEIVPYYDGGCCAAEGPRAWAG